MKAAVFRGVGDLRLEEVPDPRPNDDQVLVKIFACGVCGTDVDMYGGTNEEGTFPFIGGHEWVGEVIEVGKNVFSLSKGDRVVGETFIPCHRCRNCQDGMHPLMCERPEYFAFEWDHPGGFCEYHVSVPDRLVKVPDNLTNEEAVMSEPVSIALHGLWGAGRSVAPYDRVCVIGGGPIGLLGAQIAKSAGAKVMLVEPIPFRRQMAKDLGVDATIDPKSKDLVDQVMQLTDGRGANIVLEASGSDAGTTATIDVLSPEGTVVLVGHTVGHTVPVEVGRLIWKNAKMVGSLGAPFFLPKTLEYMSCHLFDLTACVTHRFPLDDITKAIELGSNKEKSAKIVIGIV
jgi:L-iditol 2-dehydrogenase